MSENETVNIWKWTKNLWDPCVLRLVVLNFQPHYEEVSTYYPHFADEEIKAQRG